jgi:branched-chain amino acid transport system permease protein
MNAKKYLKDAKSDLFTYAGVIIAFIVISILKANGGLNRSQTGLLVPICCYIVMAVSLNLTVGILGDLSLGHAGFMSVGAFSGVITAMSLMNVIPSAPLRLALAMIVGALFAAVIGFLIGIPVLRLTGDYLAIVTLAFGEIIKELITCLLVGVDADGLHIIFNASGSKTAADLNLLEGGRVIIKGAQGATGTKTIASFTAGFILIMITLVIVQNLIRSRHGRAIMAVRDNRIAAEAVGIPVTKYKMMAFVTSAALAGAAGALFGLNYSNLAATKFDFNTSILVLVFVVLGGLGNIWGSIIATVILYILPEALRGFASYRMLIYAIVLIVVMLTTNNPTLKIWREELREKLSKKNGKEAKDA